MLKSRSLSTRILVPIVCWAVIAALAVTWASWIIGRRWAMKEMSDRYHSIESAVQGSTFPLTPPVLRLLSQLTQTQWIAIDQSDALVSSTIGDPVPSSLLQQWSGDPKSVQPSVIGKRSIDHGPRDAIIAGIEYYAYAFDRQQDSMGSDQVAGVIVLFEKEHVSAVARRAAVSPLIAGLSTILAVGSLMLLSVSRVIHRVRRLEFQVDRIASGDFESELTDRGDDEVGRLAQAINTMAGQLKTLWNRVQAQQGEKLLHQISGGMAHQLRNTLTGAKMAMELHEESLAQAPSEEVRVAIRQLEIAEQYVNRLLALGAGEQKSNSPQSIAAGLEDVRSTHQSIARHLQVELLWRIDESVQTRWVGDGPAFSAAVSNLVLNAMQAGNRVAVAAEMDPSQRCVITVTDNGPGIDETIGETLFEPFVTSKPEGLGLGLPLVKRSAESMGGQIAWFRHGDQTRFEFSVPTIDSETSCLN